MSIARPYAVAAYEFATSERDVAAWEKMLTTAAIIAKDRQMQKLLKNVRVDQDAAKSVMHDVLKTQLNNNRKNFIDLLCDNRRLLALPQILELFRTYKDRDNKKIPAEVVSAVALDDKYKLKLEKSLAKHFQGEMELSYKLDPSILGGILVRAGDRVIDGTVRGKLSRLLESF